MCAPYIIGMKGAPVSDQFDDVYFSADNGLAETHHVFLKGNDLPAAWQEGEKPFVICETGFGTGLNFLATIKLFDETAYQAAQLHFISFEKYPLTPDFIKNALTPFWDEVGGYADKMLAAYPIRVPGFHRLSIDLNDGKRVFLTLIFDDVNDALPDLNAQVDCWFLDGFTPAKNPQMWSETLYQNMARLSVKGTRVATFTAAGDVRRGLQTAGFDVQKTEGFGRKRDMVVARFLGGEARQKFSKPSVAIIGGGLAGGACAYALKRYGLSPVIYDKNQNLGMEASGNVAGSYNPRFSAYRSAESDFYTAGFAQILRELPQFKTVQDRNIGALYLMNNAEKEKRFHRMVEEWRWQDDEMKVVDDAMASDIAGIDIKQNALHLKRSGSVSPRLLCDAYADGVEKRLLQDVKSLDEIGADIIILACATAAKNFVPWLPIYGVRGQVSEVGATSLSENLKCNIHYSGYIMPVQDGVHMVGATFQKELSHIDVLEGDHDENIAQLKNNVTAFAGENFEIIAGRAGIRTSSRDHFPIVGKVPGMTNVYVSTAHASHGIVSSLASANMIADLITAAPLSLSQSSTDALNAQRFIDRAEKKGRPIEI